MSSREVRRAPPSASEGVETPQSLPHLPLAMRLAPTNAAERHGSHPTFAHLPCGGVGIPIAAGPTHATPSAVIRAHLQYVPCSPTFRAPSPFAAAMTALGLSAASDEMAALFDEFDPDGSCAIDYSELASALQVRKKSNARRR